MTDRTGADGPGGTGQPPTALTALVAVAERLAAAPRLEPVAGRPVLEAVAEAAVAILDAEAASIAVHDPVAGRLTFVVAAGPHGAGVVGLSIDAAAGIAGYALTTGQALAVADVATDARFDRDTAARTGYVPRSILAVPLADEDGAVGVMEVLDRRGDRGFDLRDLDVAIALARPATAAVRAGDLERDGGALLRTVLGSVAGSELDAEAVDALVAAAASDLDAASEGSRWRLADRLARLREVDPASLELAIEWLDVLLRHGRDRRR
jgi:GAF domain-containing protein